MKYCNSLSMSELNTGMGRFPRSVFVGYKASCSVCAEGTLFLCSMRNAQCSIHNE